MKGRIGGRIAGAGLLIVMVACTAPASSSVSAATPGPATHFTLSATSPETAATNFYLTVTAVDASGLRATSYTGTVTLSSSDPRATEYLSSNPAFPLPNPNVSFTSANTGQRRLTVALDTNGSQTFSAQDRAGLRGTSNAITVSGGQPPSGPTRGSQLYATTFDPATFNQQLVGTSASLTRGTAPGTSNPDLVCAVGTAGSKMIASVKNWSVTEPAAIWAEYDISLAQMQSGLVASFYFEGLGGNHRHLHIDFGANTIVLRNPSYQNEGPVISVPMSGGQATHIVVVDTSPRYRVYVNGTLRIDYSDGLAASTPAGFGFDCASSNNGTGRDNVTNFALYSVTGA